MDSLYQEELEKSADKKEVNVSLDDEGIMKVLMCCQAGRSCSECPYDELDSPRCRDILLNECIGLINRLKAEKVNNAREIFAEIEDGIKSAISALQFENHPIHRKVKHEVYSRTMCFVKTIEKKYTEVGE